MTPVIYGEEVDDQPPKPIKPPKPTVQPDDYSDFSGHEHANEIRRTMHDTGMAFLQAYYHVRARHWLQRYGGWVAN